MRLLTLTIIGGLVLGTTGGAFAAEGKGQSVEKSKRESSGGGRVGSGDKGGTGGEEAIVREDRRLLTSEKAWEVETALEGHRLFRQNDLGGAADDRNLLFWSFIGRYQLTKYDQLQGYFGVYERFLADPSETGLRADDMFLGYWRFIPLPEDVELRLNARFTLPTSFASQKASLITSPSLAVRGTRVFFDDLVVNIRSRFTYDVMKYSTAEGGAPNSKFHWSFSVDAEYQMPFYHPLSVGAELYTAYHWYYQVPNQGPGLGSTTAQFNGAVQDSQFGVSQPIQQTYGQDFFVRYTFPEWNGLKTDFQVAIANGDPTLGYDGRIHDGAGHSYGVLPLTGGYRRTAEMFAILTAVY
jgi:hypothetical protein